MSSLVGLCRQSGGLWRDCGDHHLKGPGPRAATTDFSYLWAPGSRRPQAGVAKLENKTGGESFRATLQCEKNTQKNHTYYTVYGTVHSPRCQLDELENPARATHIKPYTSTPHVFKQSLQRAPCILFSRRLRRQFQPKSRGAYHLEVAYLRPRAAKMLASAGVSSSGSS